MTEGTIHAAVNHASSAAVKISMTPHSTGRRRSIRVFDVHSRTQCGIGKLGEERLRRGTRVRVNDGDQT